MRHCNFATFPNEMAKSTDFLLFGPIVAFYVVVIYVTALCRVHSARIQALDLVENGNKIYLPTKMTKKNPHFYVNGFILLFYYGIIDFIWL